MRAKKSCDNCRDGIACRACGARLKPLPGLLTARDYTLVLALIDGSDRKYAPKVLDTVATVLKAKDPKSALQRLRIKLRHLLKESERFEQGKSRLDPPDDPEEAREAIMRRAKAGEISYDEAIAEIEKL